MNKALMEMQQLAAKTQLNPVQTMDKIDSSSPQDFTQMLQTAISNVNEAQKHAGVLKKSFEVGDPSVDLPQVMLASQKAGVAFEAMIQVRNKLLQAYKDVMSMPV